MCVDDYEYRHFTARREKVCRKFIIVNEDDFARTYFVNISQFEEHGEVALCKILIYLSTKGLVIKDKKFYLPKFNAIIEPYTFCKIIFEALDDSQVLLKTYPAEKQTYEIFTENQSANYENPTHQESNQNYYCRFQQIDEGEVYELIKDTCCSKEQEITMEEDNKFAEKMIDEIEERSGQDKNQKSDELQKKLKESERGIGQVIKAVKIWRELHDFKKCNLTNAAKVVGISKKSLDDYYLVLRVGEILGFDYTNNLSKKMGDLRNFIRSKEEKITGKLGKNVECFKLVQQVNLDALLKEYHQNVSMMP